jgi:hypothetical protein
VYVRLAGTDPYQAPLAYRLDERIRGCGGQLHAQPRPDELRGHSGDRLRGQDLATGFHQVDPPRMRAQMLHGLGERLIQQTPYRTLPQTFDGVVHYACSSTTRPCLCKICRCAGNRYASNTGIEHIKNAITYYDRILRGK